MAEIPNAPVKRLLIEGAGGLRVSGPALDLSAEYVSNLLRQLGQLSAEIATSDRRKTIKDEDISTAWRQMFG